MQMEPDLEFEESEQRLAVKAFNERLNISKVAPTEQEYLADEKRRANKLKYEQYRHGNLVFANFRDFINFAELIGLIRPTKGLK